MGMTIDENIQGIQIIKAQAEWDYPIDWQIVLDGAIETMKKYQKIEDIYYHQSGQALENSLRAVIEDGKID